MTAPALAGVAATDRHVIVADRNFDDTGDVFRCLDAYTGKDAWTLRYAATGTLDFGNSPRAMPLITRDRAYLLGAFGHLHCVALDTGKVIWKKNLRDAFGADDKLVWGVCSSPLLVDGRLIVNPGGPEASLVALDPQTGDLVWKTPGGPAAFSSFIVGTFGGHRQLIGYDKTSLGGWDPATGKRLWQLIPPRENDFNVPTAIAYGERLIVATENNGCRLYQFNSEGRIDSTPLAHNRDLGPDTHSPVLVGDRLFGVWNSLHCLNAAKELHEIWSHDEPDYDSYCSIVATDDRLLVTPTTGELHLVDARADSYRLISRMKVLEGDSGVMSHPALVGKRLYLRGSSLLVCIALE
jgi:outer membrane protein assembly factor BamB